MVLSVPRPDADTPIHVVGNPIKLSKSEARPPSRWPTLGQHTEEVLRADLGLGGAELDALRGDGVISLDSKD
jgi:crotonobetainyl-CoA:carnitine CoA-transferase CaiB-like acyl-CoA transferase